MPMARGIAPIFQITPSNTWLFFLLKSMSYMRVDKQAILPYNYQMIANRKAQ